MADGQNKSSLDLFLNSIWQLIRKGCDQNAAEPEPSSINFQEEECADRPQQYFKIEKGGLAGLTVSRQSAWEKPVEVSPSGP